MLGKTKSKQYKVTGTNIDTNGLKTTITVTTDDVNVVKKLLGNDSNTMNAEFKEVKKKPKTKSKSKAKALPSPKKTSNRKAGNENAKKKRN